MFFCLGAVVFLIVVQDIRLINNQENSSNKTTLFAQEQLRLVREDFDIIEKVFFFSLFSVVDSVLFPFLYSDFWREA